ncbi:MAG: T9SS type A sorting domain-containing protein, partial [Dysgonamonadaceae bacterium]|nr:T9SS type A sorting domain-containing protein [Dysgonamonadaceae bacterium]
ESEITLGFNTGAAGSFTIQATTVSNIDSDLQIILKDKTQDIDFDLTDGNAYSFTSDVVANTESRFAIVFAPKVITGISGSAAGKLQAYVNDGKLIIKNGKLGDKVAVFNLTGQKLYGETLHSPFSTFHFQLNAGVYLVKVENQTVKVIVK